MSIISERVMSVIYLADPLVPGAGTAPGGVDTKIGTLLSWAAWIAVAVCVAGLIIGAAKMAIANHRGGEVQGIGIAMPVMAAILVVSAGSLVTGIVG